MPYTDAKPTDSKENLLNDILAAANQRHMPGLPLRPFAALMVKVADETGETVADLKAHITRLNDRNAKLQSWVVALAVAALLSTVVQAAVAVYPLFTARQASASDRVSEVTDRAEPAAPNASPSTPAATPSPPVAVPLAQSATQPASSASTSSPTPR